MKVSFFFRQVSSDRWTGSSQQKNNNMKMQTKVFLSICVLVIMGLSSGKVSAQCKKDPNFLKYQQKAGTRERSQRPKGYYWCLKYYQVTCLAKGDTDVLNGKEIPRLQQAAYALEDRINQIIEEYNKTGLKNVGSYRLSP